MYSDECLVFLVGDKLFWPLCIIMDFKYFPTGWGNKATISSPTLQSVEMSVSSGRLTSVQDNGPSAKRVI